MFEKPRGTPNLSENGEFNSPRRQSIMSSSNPRTDSLPIDCVLVYDRTRNIEPNYTPEQPRKKHYSTSERRRRFEEYLKQKQGLILKDVVSLLIDGEELNTSLRLLGQSIQTIRIRHCSHPVQHPSAHGGKYAHAIAHRGKSKIVEQFFWSDLQ